MTNFCKICNAINNKKSTKYKAITWPESIFFKNNEIIYCENCGFGWISKAPKKQELINFYETKYRNPVSPFYINFKTNYISKNRDHRSISQLRLALRYISLKSKDIFVDLGPGAGNSFKEIIRLYKKKFLNLCAIELNKDAAQYYKKNFNVHTFGTLENLINNLKKKPKFLLSSHSLEHFELNDAIKFLKKLKKNIDKNGICLFEVPHVDLRIHKEIRGQDDPHLLFFSKKSLIHLFKNCGFNILFIETCGDFYKKEILGISNFIAFIKLKLIKFIKKYLSFLLPYQHLIFKKNKINLNDVNFKYGGKMRESIRIVVSPK